MKPVKRLEIVIDPHFLHRLLRELEAVGVDGYTVIDQVRGKGERGLREADALADIFTNTYVLVACPEDVANRALEAIRPLLKLSGGMCLLSDAQWLKH